jgi:ATP-dependent exoDNAse (exonuclease V) beta subunit
LQWFNEKGRTKSIISPEGANAIKIMTVHKSKGLQFPVVICPFFDWDLKLSNQIVWVKQAGEPLPAYFVNMIKDLADTKLSSIFFTEQAKYSLDNFNMLYVAFTRPEVALFICGRERGVATNIIIPTLKKSDVLKAQDNGLYTNGHLEFNNNSKKNGDDQNIAIQFLKQKMNKPELSYKSALEWDIDELDQKRNFGTLVHYVLSKIEQYDALETVLDMVRIKQGLTDADLIEVRNYINPLFENKKFASYFSADSLNEKEMISADGKKLIPDKIIKQREGYVVVDFKTGQPTPKHKKQVETYIKTYQDMGFKNVSGEIFYTETLDFTTV